MHRRNFASNTVGGEGGKLTMGITNFNSAASPPPKKNYS